MSFLNKEILSKIQQYCTYQERCHSEVRSKLYALGCNIATTEELIAQLIETGFLNESRFASSFARGKFRYNQWGRNKIRFELKAKKISDACIRIALKEIDETEYLDTLKKLSEGRLKNPNDRAARQKTVQWLMGKGYEYECIKQVL